MNVYYLLIKVAFLLSVNINELHWLIFSGDLASHSQDKAHLVIKTYSCFYTYGFDLLVFGVFQHLCSWRALVSSFLVLHIRVILTSWNELRSVPSSFRRDWIISHSFNLSRNYPFHSKLSNICVSFPYPFHVYEVCSHSLLFLIVINVFCVFSWSN